MNIYVDCNTTKMHEIKYKNETVNCVNCEYDDFLQHFTYHFNRIYIYKSLKKCVQYK